MNNQKIDTEIDFLLVENFSKALALEDTNCPEERANTLLIEIKMNHKFIKTLKNLKA